MTSKQKIEKGDKYNFLELTGKYEYRRGGALYVEAMCICGNIKYIKFFSLKINETKSCGCKQKELVSAFVTKHGMSASTNKKGHPIYDAYNNMIDRCNKIGYKPYERYWGRGISVCKEWMDDFLVFKEWALANGWERGLTLERMNNDKNYEPSNCKWDTRAIQARNREVNILLTAFGETKCLAEWSRDLRCKVRYEGLRTRINKLGWDAERAIVTPPSNQWSVKKAA